MGAETICQQPKGEEGLLQLCNPGHTIGRLLERRNLIRRLVVRQVTARYKGSFLGIIWSLVTPLMMLAVFVFVFGVVFEGRWGRPGETGVDYGLALFAGLIVYSIFQECVAGAPQLVLSHTNYVKRVVFPIEILPVAALGGALVNAGLSLCVLIPLILVLGTTMPTTIYLFPLTLIPLCALTLGLTYFLSSLGVFVRDIGHPVGVLVTVLLFLSGIFFPISAVPGGFQGVLELNPLVHILESSRRTLLWGETLDFRMWLVITLVSLVVMQLGYAWFMKSRGAFADVL